MRAIVTVKVRLDVALVLAVVCDDDGSVPHPVSSLRAEAAEAASTIKTTKSAVKLPDLTVPGREA